MGTEGEMLQAPTATANHGTRGAAEERHFENLKVPSIRLGALIGADSGSRSGTGYPSPSIRRRRKVGWYYG